MDRQLWAVVLAHVGAVEEALLPRDDEHHRVDLDALVLPEGDLRLADQLGYNLTDPRLVYCHVSTLRAHALHINVSTPCPKGQQYEKWLKSKGRREDGGNSGPS